jgi:ergothioneine biosynthesis protein EgtB
MLDDLLSRVLATRRATLRLVEPLDPEDMVAQSMPDASPTKWHLAHTTWFFERFVLRRAGVPAFDPAYDYLFNSYYESVGPRHARQARGLLTRPSLAEVIAYRRAVDARLGDLAGAARASTHASTAELAAALELGKNHEEQHQELVLTDVKHLFGESPLAPAYRPAEGDARDGRALASGMAPAAPLGWRAFEGGLATIGHDGRGFSFDNERPTHRVHLAPFAIASRLVTCGEYQAFVEDGGYERPELWLSDGWSWARAGGRRAPAYWRGADVFTLRGVRARDEEEPVCHVTYYEADAYARWTGARLPTEAELEVACARSGADAHGARGELAETGRLHPARATRGDGIAQLIGDCWEWTASAYAPYPGFRPLEGAFGEYNGKFMVSQLVLRGGSCLTPRDHVRATYRNFFPPHAAWQMTGIRLARDA